MNRSMFTGAALMLCLGLAAPSLAQEAPAAPSLAQEAPATPAEAPPTAVEPAAPAAAPAAAVPAAEEKATIYFFRPWRITGGAYTYHVVEVGEDGKAAKDAPRVASLPNGGAHIVQIEPGLHTFNITGPMAVNKAEDRLRIEVEPGESYYIEQTVRMGVVTGGFRLTPANEARYAESNTKTKDAKPEPKSRASRSPTGRP